MPPTRRSMVIAATILLLAACGEVSARRTSVSPAPTPIAASSSPVASTAAPSGTPTAIAKRKIRFGGSRVLPRPFLLGGVYGAINVWFFAERDENITLKAYLGDDLVASATSEGIYDWRGLLLDPKRGFDRIVVDFTAERRWPDGGFNTTGVDDLTLWPVGATPYPYGRRRQHLVSPELEELEAYGQERLRTCQALWAGFEGTDSAEALAGLSGKPGSGDRCAELMGGFRTTRFGSVKPK